MLDRDETQKLITLAQSGDESAKATLITENSPLVKSVLRRYKNKGVEYDDLYQLGCIGLLKAINNFNSEFGVRFSTYAVPMIAGEIKRYLRDDGYVKVSRSTKSLACKIAYFVDEYRAKSGVAPTLEIIAEKFGVDPQEVVYVMDSSKFPVSIYDGGDDEDGQPLSDKLTNGDSTDDEIDKIIIKEGIAKLTERERKIILLRYYRDKTQSEVARELSVSQVQISRLEAKIIKKLRDGFD